MGKSRKMLLSIFPIVLLCCMLIGIIASMPTLAFASASDKDVLGVNCNTAQAARVYLGSCDLTDDGIDNPTPIEWKVIGYNGAGVQSSENTLTLISSDIVGTARFNLNGSNVYTAYNAANYPMKAYLDSLADSLTTREKNALKTSTIDGSYSIWSGYFVPIDKYNIYNKLSPSIINIGKKYLTTDGHVTESGDYTEYNVSATNNNRCIATIDATKIESVELGDDGVYTFHFAPIDPSILSVSAYTASAQIVNLGTYDSTDDGIDNPTPMKWIVVGYNDKTTALFDKEGYLTLFSLDGKRFGKTAFGEDNNYASSYVKQKLSGIADTAFSENEKFGIKAAENYDNEILWAPERGFSVDVANAYNDGSYYWWTRTPSSLNTDEAYVFSGNFGTTMVYTQAYVGFCVYIDLSSIDTVTENDDGSFSMTFIPPHIHTWEGAVGSEENVLTAVCAGAGNCAISVTPTVTVNAENDNWRKDTPYAGASITVENWEQDNLAAAPTLVYVSKDGTTYPESSTAPVHPGEYYAKVSFGGATAKKEFIIERATNGRDSFSARIEEFKGYEYGSEPKYPDIKTYYGSVVFLFSNSRDGVFTETVPTEIGGAYYVKAHVDGTADYTEYNSDVYWFYIHKRTNAFTVQPSVTNWKYGEAPSVPIAGQAKYGAETVVYYYYKAYGTPSTEIPSQVGSYYMRAEIAEGDTYTDAQSEPVSFKIEKGVYAGTADPLCSLNIKSGKTAPVSFDLSEYLLGVNNYKIESAAENSDDDGIIAAVTTDAEKKLLTVTGSASSVAGKTARITITVSSDIYEDFHAFVEVTTIGKTLVNISFDAENHEYDGNQAIGYGNIAVDNHYDKSELLYSYAVAGGDALSEAPVNVGSYTVTIFISATDEDYEGSITKSFEISVATNTFSSNPDEYTGWTYGDNNTQLIGVLFGAPVYGFFDADGNALETKPINAGNYKLSVHVDGTSNYSQFDSEKINFTIHKKSLNSALTVQVANADYDGTPKIGYDPTTLELDGYDTDKLKVIYVQNETALSSSPVSVGQYAVVFAIPENDDGNYSGLAGFVFNINKAENYILENDFVGWRFEDGNPELPKTRFGEPTYSFTEENGDAVEGTPVNIGSYRVQLHVEGTDNYDEYTSSFINFKIKRKLLDLSGITFENETIKEDGKAHSLTITGNLPKGVTVSYQGSSAGTKPGEYTFIAVLRPDSSLYESNEEIRMTAILTIEKGESTFPLIPVVIGAVAVVAITIVVIVLAKKKRHQ